MSRLHGLSECVGEVGFSAIFYQDTGDQHGVALPELPEGLVQGLEFDTSLEVGDGGEVEAIC